METFFKSVEYSGDIWMYFDLFLIVGDRCIS